MQLGIRTKLITILALAAVVPVVVAIVASQTVGYNQRVTEKGLVYANEARLIAENLMLAVGKETGTLRDLTRFSGLTADLAAHNREFPIPEPEALSNEVERIESAWPGLRPNQAWVAATLTNELAIRLRSFRASHPLFAELLVTDPAGRLVAATGKASDYYQADEEWWREGAARIPGEAWVGGLAWDESAEVFSLDVALPLHLAGDPEKRLQGVMKAVIGASHFFGSIPLKSGEGATIREVAHADGRILLRLLDEAFQPRSETVSREVIRRLSRGTNQWFLARMSSGAQHMIGHAPLELLGVLGPSGPAGRQPLLHVMVHQRTSVVLAPLRRQVLLLTGLGFAGVLGFAAIGLYVAQMKLLRPLEALRRASHAVAERVERERQIESPTLPLQPSAETVQLLAPLEKVRTGDEIELLASDFRQMASRVLRYQEHLRAEIAAKTEEIRRDLDMAREFQEALLPRQYPEVPSDGASDSLGLQFCHIYRPASTVGGDFFDIIKLSDHRAGVLVADVMGHGARSALVTAIIRTLLQDMVREAGDPAKLLELLNAHFHRVVGQTQQTLFVSAFYMVADTQSATLHYASAGHPSPLVLDRRTGDVSPLISRLTGNPALGFFGEASYTVFRRPIRAEELYLVFTDGLLEAPSVDDREEFGVGRVVDAARRHLDQPLTGVIQGVVDAVSRFAGERPPPDDICLVAMEVLLRRSTAVVAERGAVTLVH